MCRMCDQTEGRGARIKSKLSLDPTSHDREQIRERETLFVSGYEFDVV